MFSHSHSWHRSLGTKGVSARSVHLEKKTFELPFLHNILTNLSAAEVPHSDFAPEACKFNTTIWRLNHSGNINDVSVLKTAWQSLLKLIGFWRNYPFQIRIWYLAPLTSLKCSLPTWIGYLGACKQIHKFVMLITVLANTMADHVINVYQHPRSPTC